MIQRLIGKIIFMVLKAAGKCLAAFLIKKYIKRGNVKMATTKMNIWAALGQIALAIGTSYLSAKISDKTTGWVSSGYRDQLVANAATVVLTTAAQQVADMQQPAATAETATTADTQVAQTTVQQ